MYRRERMGRALREQLTRMGFRSEEVLDGRPIDLLSADEVYVLAKTLPNFSAEQKREAYRAILTEAIETGETQSAESLKILSDLRAQLGLSDAEHHAIIDVLGIHDPTLLDPQVARGVELRMRHENYRKFLLTLVQHAQLKGRDRRRLPRQRRRHAGGGAGAGAVQHLRARITPESPPKWHATRCCSPAGSGSCSRRCANWRRRASRCVSIGRPEAPLLRHALLLKQQILIREAVSLLTSIGDRAAGPGRSRNRSGRSSARDARGRADRRSSKPCRTTYATRSSNDGRSRRIRHIWTWSRPPHLPTRCSVH